ncbi:MAG TPA: FAD-linked oxidase C-terminal domain-containing protein, partial [Pyrinomonadaceae bacterium]|nr:FAD-linked oxidase C-terminal domain-containing protein [Pyrinomonadaceae bacterium]
QGVVIELARMRRLLKIDAENRFAVVETGMVNAKLSKAAAPYGLHYVPDPSSQMSCTIGGNVAENSGGIHCLKYGMTVDHVLAARVVLAGGEIVDLGSNANASVGYDLLGVFVGSEGTFGIATEATLKLVPLPSAVRTLLAIFADVDDASRAVSAIIAAGLVPAALEMMDGAIIRAVEASVFAAGIPLDAEAALLVELDGLEAGLDEEAERASLICREHGAESVRCASDDAERKRLWAARKGAFGAMGRISPDTMLQDAVVPRSRLPEILAATYRIGAKYGLRVANVFHAGDGNLHPFLCFDARHPDEVLRVKEAGRELMETCVRAGGSITGEHGVGLDKSDYLPLIFSEDDMETMLRVRAAFDPTGLCNPGKIIPTPRTCSEGSAITRRGDAETRGDSESESPGAHASLRASLREQANVVRAGALNAGNSLALPAITSAHSFNTEEAQRLLSKIVGDENISASPRLRVPASFPSSSLAVAPASAEEACEVLRLASSEGWKVVPAGSETWLDVGNPLKRADVILSTRRMNRVIEHEPADLVTRMEAGVTLSALNAELARARQWLPVDPPDQGSASVGGIVATGLSGAQGLGYGNPRSYVIGMRVALADGRTIKAGGRVVKNVAGYDLCKLFTGSYGTLGLILELVFKLRPVPAYTTTAAACAPLDSLLRAAHSILSARLLPVAVELLSSSAASRVGVSDEDTRPTLLVRYAGTHGTVAFQTEQTVKIFQNEDARLTSYASDDDESYWRKLNALPLQNENQLIWRANVLPSEMQEFLNHAMTDDGARLISSSSLWHAGIGDGRLRVISSETNDAALSVASLESLRLRAKASGGTLMIESAPMEIKGSIDAWGEAGAAAYALMRRLKLQLDPQNSLSPGRFNFN